MSRGIFTKFCAFVLAVLTLTVTTASILIITLLSFQGLYGRSLADAKQAYLWDQKYDIAYGYARRYAAEHLGGCSRQLVEKLYGLPESSEEQWSGILMLDNDVLSKIGTQPENAETVKYTFTVSYPCAIPYDAEADTESLLSPAVGEKVTVAEETELNTYLVYYSRSPEYTVLLSLPTPFEQQTAWALLELLYPQRYTVIAYAAVSTLLFAACMVYLCCAAGRIPGSNELRPGGLNRLPLDLYAAFVSGLGGFACYGCVELAKWTLSGSFRYGGLILEGILIAVVSVLVIGLFLALAAQIKFRPGYWWRNSILGRLLIFGWHGLRLSCRGIGQLFTLLPMIWQWLLTAAALAIAFFLSLIAALNSHTLILQLPAFCVALLCGGFVCYCGYALGTLLSGITQMKRGKHRISTKYLFGSFRTLADGLNGLSESATVAAQKQLRSERMKTELITNVSHDIKTPLTSIINYVDLLEKPHSEADGQKYLDVLSRQSLRLKKLIDDLMEMSKASTGNLTVSIAQLDCTETINQALGEFSAKLDAARLTPVFTAPEDPLTLLADGRLVWRVLSNLLSNVVKYAQPDTRLYIDTAKVNGQVMISIKNISREPLNISSEELLERFVRGDSARHTEGSGLGLNIAKSLMEVQNGHLRVLVDGDLFKVTLLFPSAEL